MPLFHELGTTDFETRLNFADYFNKYFNVNVCLPEIDTLYNVEALNENEYV